MPAVLVFNREKSEIEILRMVTNRISSIKEEIDFYAAMSFSELSETLAKLPAISVFCTDFAIRGEQSIRLVKGYNPEALVIVLVDQNMSPSAYIRPSIMAAGLLLRPLTVDQACEVLKSVIDAYRAKERLKLYHNEIFTISTRNGLNRIPYSELLYFEARSKKIAACTRRAEAEFYSTIESLSEKLPYYFIRCHKSFIVNCLMVEHVDFSTNTINLVGGFSIPVSRSYRAAVREALHE